jgi:hypothetical protein
MSINFEEEATRAVIIGSRNRSFSIKKNDQLRKRVKSKWFRVRAIKFGFHSIFMVSKD